MPRSSPVAQNVIQEAQFEQHFGVSRMGDQSSTPPQFFWALQNMYVSKENWVEQRNGSVVFTNAPLTGAPKIRKLFEVENKTGGRTIIGRGGTRWARVSGTTWVDLDTSRGSDVKGQITQFNYKFVMCDGGGPRISDMSFSVSDLVNEIPAWLTGTAYIIGDHVRQSGNVYLAAKAHTSGVFATDLASGDWVIGASNVPTHSSACHTHNHRLVLNDDDNQLNVVISQVDSPIFCTDTDDAINISLSNLIKGGDSIIGYSTYLQTYLVIWLNHHIVIYNLPTTFANISLQQVIRGTGCISYDGIKEVGKDLWFPSEKGYMSLAEIIGNPQVVDLQTVTRRINPYYRDSLKNIQDTTDICAIYYPNLDHFYFTFPFSGGTEVWVVSKDLEMITQGVGNIAGGPFTGITPYSFLYREDRTLYYGGDDGHIYQMDTGTNDNGNTIAVVAQKTGISFGDYGRYKSPREFEMLVKATKNLTPTLSWDFALSKSTQGQISESLGITTQTSPWNTSLWNVSYWGAGGMNLFRTRDLFGRGRIFDFAVSHNTLDAQIKFRNWILRYQMQGRN